MEFSEIKQLAKWDQQQVYKGLTFEFQMKIQRSFAQFHMPFVDKFYSETLKSSCVRDERYKQHATLTYGGRKLFVLEKYKTSDSPEFTLEILKNLSFPPDKAFGIFFDKRFNRLVQIVCASPDGMFSAPKPTKIYVANLDKMRGGLEELLKAGGKSSLFLGTKFKNVSISLNLEWSLLQTNEMASVYNI